VFKKDEREEKRRRRKRKKRINLGKKGRFDYCQITRIVEERKK